MRERDMADVERPTPSAQRHRDEARRLVREWCEITPPFITNGEREMLADAFASALARVEESARREERERLQEDVGNWEMRCEHAETQWHLADERIASLRSVLTPLQALAEKATRGTWRVGKWNGKDGWPTVEVNDSPVRRETICCLSYAEADHLHGMTKANAELIVAAVNAVSLLTNALASEPAEQAKPDQPYTLHTLPSAPRRADAQGDEGAGAERPADADIVRAGHAYKVRHRPTVTIIVEHGDEDEAQDVLARFLRGVQSGGEVVYHAAQLPANPEAKPTPPAPPGTHEEER